ncbi:acyl transferase [Funiculus sociatus GB2-C1]|uniref:acyl transferase n=1 Tax=Trichocoleus sp. FACHB-69 TaxID=2692874 RepID=UPI001F54B6C8|nr:acyl transferase [Trichocoleus sp. FACHB-69]
MLFSLYGFPLLVYRIHELFYPIKEGISYLGTKEYSPWWGSHQIQVIYIAFPALETLLRLIPGAFSIWLRLWGAKVGKSVYWTPQLEIADRGLVEIGDRVIFGHGVGIYSHIIKPRKNDLMLYVKKVKIGTNVFLGAWNHVGPGVAVEDETYVPVATHLYPNKKFSKD